MALYAWKVLRPESFAMAFSVMLAFTFLRMVLPSKMISGVSNVEIDDDKLKGKGR